MMDISLNQYLFSIITFTRYRLSGKHRQHGHGQRERGHGHVKIRQKAIKEENEKKIISTTLQSNNSM